MSDLEWLKPFIAVLGVPPGFALGQWDAWRRGRREARGARLLLRLEIDDNLDEVVRYREEAADRALEEMVPPAWQREAWASQLARLPAALNEAELEQVRRFYSRIDLIAEHHLRARTAVRDPLIQAREVEAAEELTRCLERERNPLAEDVAVPWHRRLTLPGTLPVTPSARQR